MKSETTDPEWEKIKELILSGPTFIPGSNSFIKEAVERAESLLDLTEKVSHSQANFADHRAYASAINPHTIWRQSQDMLMLLQAFVVLWKNNV